MSRRLIVAALLLLAVPLAAQVTRSNTSSFGGGLTVGTASPTTITNIRVYAPTCTPLASSAAIQTHTLACTVTGVTTADKVIVNPPGNTSLCPFVNARVSGADTVTLSFSVLTAAACTATAGTYAIVAFRS